MSLSEDITNAIAGLSDDWTVVQAQTGSTQVADTDTLVGNKASSVKATYLYTDMVDSSGLMAISPRSTVASVISAFLKCAVRIIRSDDGHIRSFDGDRVMGVFTGPSRQTRAVKAALKINFAVNTMLNPAIQQKFKSIRESDWDLRQMTGIASGDVLLVKVGIRNNNDVLSAGVAPNLAAKLSDLRQSNSHRTIIGKGTYDALEPSALYSAAGKNIWSGPFTVDLRKKQYSYYTSNFHRTFK
ncbi:MAG: adenylate/guanylate cyclase domain-containing protein [Homoserinimonas sp.]